ncbi:MAG TPA: hypothetical protein VKU02_08855 [Gemmataceae bacterium]|nr:hypothetical protein [Gemmataceae bacterium]
MPKTKRHMAALSGTREQIRARIAIVRREPNGVKHTDRIPSQSAPGSTTIAWRGFSHFEPAEAFPFFHSQVHHDMDKIPASRAAMVEGADRHVSATAGTA